jgi:hypothetical protein
MNCCKWCELLEFTFTYSGHNLINTILAHNLTLLYLCETMPLSINNLHTIFWQNKYGLITIYSWISFFWHCIPCYSLAEMKIIHAWQWFIIKWWLNTHLNALTAWLMHSLFAPSYLNVINFIRDINMRFNRGTTRLHATALV